MMRRIAVVVLAAGGLALALRAQADEMRPAIGRPEIMEVGDPILISRKQLALEMTRNIDLRDWVRLYGVPDYAEVQEIQIEAPFAPYEVRLYYLKRNAYLAYGRVHVAPSIFDYGVRKYIGAIDPSVLDRLLTAQPVTASASPATATSAAAESNPQPVAPAAVVVETVAGEAAPVGN